MQGPAGDVAHQLAEIAVQAADRQRTSLPGEKLAAQLVHTLAREVMALNQRIAELDKAIEAQFRDHATCEVITSMPGLGIILGAEFLAATGGDMAVFGTADRLAGFGGVASVPRDSGRSAATCGVRSDTTAVSNGSSTSRRCSASGTAPSPVSFTIASGPRATRSGLRRDADRAPGRTAPVVARCRPPGRPAQPPYPRRRHRARPRRRHRWPHPALELRRRRRTRQPHQDAQTADVRPRRLRSSP